MYRSDEYFEFKTLIYKGELDRIAGWVEEYPDLETGGQLFGFWTESGFPMIQVVLGPGAKSKHTPVSFHQHGEYLKETGEYLNRQYGLQHIGEWHSHHSLSLNTPSDGDSRTMWRALARRNLSRFLLCIANIYPTKALNRDSYNVAVTSLHLPITNKEERIIKVNCFLYTQSRPSYQIGAWVVLQGVSGESPLRQFINYECILKHGLKEPKLLECDVNKTTLDAPVFEISKEIEVSDNQWYAAAEGRKMLIGIFTALNNNFDNCQMFRDESERVYFTFQCDREACRIEFPDNFPQEWAKFSSDTIGETHLEKHYTGKKICKAVRGRLKHTRL
jgi:hypothetical protein